MTDVGGGSDYLSGVEFADGGSPVGIAEQPAAILPVERPNNKRFSLRELINELRQQVKDAIAPGD